MPRSKQTKWQLADSFVYLRSDRAKPASEMERSGIERALRSKTEQCGSLLTAMPAYGVKPYYLGKRNTNDQR
ncbi:MAG: hypothetical protein HDR17_07375 [Lachnospiraceae bacterium]|nr:hypothetical protein [Lachnospiraceae bacterium]